MSTFLRFIWQRFVKDKGAYFNPSESIGKGNIAKAVIGANVIIFLFQWHYFRHSLKRELTFKKPSENDLNTYQPFLNNGPGVIVVDKRGRRSRLIDEESTEKTVLYKKIYDNSHSLIKELDETNNLWFLRLTTEKNDIFITPEKDSVVAVIFEQK